MFVWKLYFKIPWKSNEHDILFLCFFYVPVLTILCFEVWNKTFVQLPGNQYEQIT
uniref:Uncharacterized protein n=1 Tax=Oryza brachyantha TaxID=4533 RepID=J3MVQ4_ORYBR